MLFLTVMFFFQSKRTRTRRAIQPRSPDEITPFPKDPHEGKDTLIEEEASSVGRVCEYVLPCKPL